MADPGDDPQPSNSPGSGRGKLILKVKDGDGDRRPFIEIHVVSGSGLTTTTLKTDAKGVARSTLTPGRWTAEIAAGCQPEMWITRGDRANFGVAARATVRGTLTIEAKRALMPGPPTRWNAEPPWAPGREIQVETRLVNRCNDQLVPNVGFKDRMFATAEGAIELVSFATGSDDEAWIKLSVRCAHVGDAEIWFYDRFKPRDRVDILSFTPPLDPNASWCG